MERKPNCFNIQWKRYDLILDYKKGEKRSSFRKHESLSINFYHHLTTKMEFATNRNNKASHERNYQLSFSIKSSGHKEPQLGAIGAIT